MTAAWGIEDSNAKCMDGSGCKGFDKEAEILIGICSRPVLSEDQFHLVAALKVE